MTSTETMILELITNAKRILVFSHIRPDWDAFASALLTTELIKTSFPDKEIANAIEKGSITNGNYLPNFDSIITGNAVEVIKAFSPDLIIITDCPTLSRISFDSEAITGFYTSSHIATVGLDHHELVTTTAPTYMSNHGYNAGVEEIFTLFVKTFGFKETPNALKLLAAGIIGDTNNFLFMKGSYAQTFAYASYLLEHGIDFAEIDRQQNRYESIHILIIGEFLKNLTVTEFITYTFVSDKFYGVHPEINRDKYTESKEIFQLHFIRQVSDNKIVFLLYPEVPGYKGSLRSISDTYDTTVFAKYLNGGGHKTASGFKLIEPKTITEGIETVLTAINTHKQEALIH